MFRSKNSYLIASIVMMIFALYLVSFVISRWSDLMQQDRMLLFMRILGSALFTYKTIDYFIEWRNWGKPYSEED